MRRIRRVLDTAVERGIIERQQASALAALVQAELEEPPRFTFVQVLYYFGGLIAIAAMSLFMTRGWEAYGGWGLSSIALVYAGMGLWLAERFRRRGHEVPAGVCATFVVTLAPLIVYGVQQAMGGWPESVGLHRYAEGHRLYMELAAVAAGAVLLYRYRYPFLVMPMAVAMWCFAMDWATVMLQAPVGFELRAQVSMYFGLLMLLGAFWLDVRTRGTRDFPFWMYLFGVMAFWGGLSAQSWYTEWSKLIYFAINLVLIGVGVLLVRRVFVVFGGLGSAFYLGHLAADLFRDSWWFPLSLSAIGLLIVALGVLWQKHERTVALRTVQLLPRPVRELLERRIATLG